MKKVLSLPLVSVIIPTKNSSAFLEACLVSIKKQTYQKIEIIVVDNGSTDDTKKIAKKYANKLFNKGPERSAQRNYGARNATGEFLLFIDSDMELSPEVVRSCVKTITENESVLAIVIPEKSVGIGFWAECKALERSFYVGVDWIEAARFFEKNSFFSLNGYDENNTGTEDYDLPQRLVHLFGKNKVRRIYKYIYHNEGKLSLSRTLEKKMYYGAKLSRYISTNKLYFIKQSSILERFKLYFSRPKKLFKNPFIGLGMIFMKLCEFILGNLGYLSKKIS